MEMVQVVSHSIYGEKFKDENFILKHYSAGWVSMANSGKDSNGSQFFITLKGASWLDKKNVVFGKVLKGIDVVRRIEMLGSDSDYGALLNDAYLDIKVGTEYWGRIEIGLFGMIVPKTVKNFYELCERPTGKGYKGTKFYRVISDFMMIGGDIENGTGLGGYSIYGETFKDENFKLRHYGAGWVSMSNHGKDTNNSKFFIVFKTTEWLDGRYVVFGKVLNGMDVVRKIEHVATDQRSQPLVNVIIDNCTTESLDKPYVVKSQKLN
ncbi:hypothetical protein FQR65_LT00665 [Abscondita terminalis]|nr:hypothetical protein FQR65_LT00665 [Abscondita terminalis]